MKLGKHIMLMFWSILARVLAYLSTESVKMESYYQPFWVIGLKIQFYNETENFDSK